MSENRLIVDESARLAELTSLGLLDSPREERFDRITRLARHMFGVEVAVITLVDDRRVWFKSKQGLAGAGFDRDHSMCARVITDGQPLMISDAALDSRFAEHPLVAGMPAVRFYAGYPLAGPRGVLIGTMAVMDSVQRFFGNDDMSALRDLAMTVEQHIIDAQLSNYYELTGLSNRRGFSAIGHKVLEMSIRSKVAAVLVYLDMDRLKPINDQLGHQYGDSALREVAGILMNVFRSSDVIARVGGDEFVVLLSGAVSAEVAVRRLRRTLDERNAVSELAYPLSMSIGVAEFDPHHPCSLDDLVRVADNGMRQEKSTKPSSREVQPLSRPGSAQRYSP